jgi:hypothetical protein
MHFQLFKVKIIMSQRVVFFFLPNFASGEFLLILIPDSQRSLGPLPTFPFIGGFWGKSLRKIISKPQFCSKRLSTNAQSIAHTQGVPRFDFNAKKQT